MPDNEASDEGESPVEKTFLNRPAKSPGSVDQFAATISPEAAAGEPDPFAATVSPDEAIPGTAENLTFTLGSLGTPRLAEPPPPPPDIPGYVLLDELGRGGMGVVYKAMQARLNRTVALKMILAGEFAGTDARARFMGEAEVVARLQHPNIVQLYEFNVHNGVPYFSLEFVDGGPLNGKLAKEPLPPGEAAALVETLARAVHYAHQQNVVHRDLKPGNILLQSRPVDPSDPHVANGGSHSQRRSLHGDGSFGTLSCVIRNIPFVPKITDFGLAKTTSGASDLTRTGAVMGTPSYMAPEQAGGDSRNVGAAADTYALGAILYECLTGRPPFHAANPIETIQQVVHEDPVPPKRLQSNVPRDLETICLKCLHKDPVRRYGTTLELADDLARYLNGDSIRARPVGPAERCYRWARRHKAAAALVVVSSLFLLTAAIVGWLVSARLGVALRDARQQRTLAEQNAAEADLQRQAVDAALRKRLETVDDILFNFDARLANEPGVESIRGELLHDVRKLSDQLLAENPDDPAVIRQAVRVHQGIGDLTRDGKSYRESEAAYAKAIGLGDSLVGRFPDRSDYQFDLASTTARQARMYWADRRFAKAEAGFAAAMQLYDQVAARPGQREAAVRSARSAFSRANVIEEMNRPPDAVAAFRDALARCEKLSAEKPDDSDIREDLGRAAGGLALALEKTEPDEAVRLLRVALSAQRLAVKANPRSARRLLAMQDAFDDLYAFCQRHHRDADLAALAKEYADAPPTRDGGGSYNAACYFALAAKAAAENATLPTPERATRADGYAKKAVEYLDRAIEEGFADRAHLLKDSDLDGLRDRAEYKAFLTRLEKRFPGRPVTPADLLASLREEFDNYQARFDRRQQTALTAAEKNRVARSKPDFPRIAGKVLKLAEENPDNSAALDAVAWVIQTGYELDNGQESSARAMRMLGRFADRPQFASACKALAECPSPAGDKLLATAAMNHKDHDVRGVAGYALGLSLAKQAGETEAGTALQAQHFSAAEARFEQTVKEFGGVAYQDSTLAALAQKKLHELRALSIGRRAREIDGADLAGKPLRLSAYRGKVTLVFFWANWCGYCRQLFPPARGWLDKYDTKTFAIVGVNCDEEKLAADRAVERERLTWPSWWDGGEAGRRIAEQWQIDAFPTLYLIDHDGVIRYRWQGKPEDDEIREAIEDLLAKAARRKG